MNVLFTKAYWQPPGLFEEAMGLKASLLCALCSHWQEQVIFCLLIPNYVAYWVFCHVEPSDLLRLKINLLRITFGIVINYIKGQVESFSPVQDTNLIKCLVCSYVDVCVPLLLIISEFIYKPRLWNFKKLSLALMEVAVLWQPTYEYVFSHLFETKVWSIIWVPALALALVEELKNVKFNECQSRLLFSLLLCCGSINSPNEEEH